MGVDIIAEAAQGFEGDPTLARLLARAAIQAGADAVKFQLVYADELAVPEYQHYHLFQSLEMPEKAWRQIREDTRRAGIRLHFDVFGERSLAQASTLGADGVKIHGSDFFNTRLVENVLRNAPRMYVSLGGIAVEELAEFISKHRISPEHPVYFLYGFQAEPTPPEANNLRRLKILQARFPGYQFGFMDHTDGASPAALTLALLAVSYEIRCIEKHITLDRSLQLEDYVSALDPAAFRAFVQQLHALEPALGSEDLTLSAGEREYRRKAVKVVVTNRAMRRGDRVDASGLALKRVPSVKDRGFLHIEEVVGRTLMVDVQPNEQLTQEMVQ